MFTLFNLENTWRGKTWRGKTWRGRLDRSKFYGINVQYFSYRDTLYVYNKIYITNILIYTNIYNKYTYIYKYI